MFDAEVWFGGTARVRVGEKLLERLWLSSMMVPLTSQDIRDGIPGVGPCPPLHPDICKKHAQQEKYLEIRRRVWLSWNKNGGESQSQSCDVNMQICNQLEQCLEKEFGEYIRSTEESCEDCNGGMILVIWTDFVDGLYK